IESMRQHNVRGIVLAGRPYHLDPEINHGIPELIVGLGMGALTEDSVCDGRLERPLRVRDQWAYHSRLYEAAARVGDEPDLEMVQLNSFGCGVDAITADQVQEILEGRGDVHTVLKIDEISNLGAARIRLRSLDAAIEERGNVERESQTVDTTGHIHERTAFTRQMREAGWQILVPQMAPFQFSLLVPVLHRAGLNVRLLERTSPETLETGLKYVNNDACYPALVVIGQLIDEFVAGRADPDRTAVAITQTGGMCRATNYASLLRKGLRDAGFEQVPVIAASLQELEGNPGFELTVPLLHKAIQAIVLGDMLQTMVLRLRPYEADEGTVMSTYRHWDQICREWLQTGSSPTYGRRLTYHRLIRACVRAFDAIAMRDIARKPRVGLVGEILVKFHPEANNHAVRVIEEEGCEAELPALIQFFHNAMASATWNAHNLGITGSVRWLKPLALWAM
ncbi:MAG: 2-hydroxyacyl-CoA dehydratase, partial [Actinomyces sp.]|nr:2-hydroxyacyl-CoA dehydratase [Actinomyces sp.]